MSSGREVHERGLGDTRNLDTTGGLRESTTVFYERARNWWIGSDPGLLRLRMATRTTAALACSLAMLSC